jgi:hypothetical protein
MKKTFWLAAIFASVLFAALPAPAAKADVGVSFSFFSNSLTPYGSWVSIGNYGRCWYPAGVPAGWQPYTVGHWGYGPYGWTWVSADPWGDVTYRYGTWTYQPPYGWVWVPGYVWGPSWVTWSYTNDYIGWAPIPPSFSFAVGGYFGSPVVVNRSWYCFVPTRHFATTNVAYARVPVRQNAALLSRSQSVTRFPVSNGIVRNTGIDVRNVEQRSQNRIQRVSQREIRTAPARVDTLRASSRNSNGRLSVAAPASAKPAVRPSEQRASQQRASQRNDFDRSKPAAAPRSVREAPASRPNARPAPQDQKSDMRRSQPSRSNREVSRPAPQPPAKTRPSASSESGNREKARAARPPERRPVPSSSARQERSAPRPSSERVSSPERKTSATRPQSRPQQKPKPNPKDQSQNERGRS